MKEREFQRWITDVADRFHWLWWHVPAPMRFDSKSGTGFVGAREAAGLSDLILAHLGKRRLVFAEVKGEKGKLTDSQVEFLETIAALEMPQVESYAWWPGMEDEIERILRGH